MVLNRANGKLNRVDGKGTVISSVYMSCIAFNKQITATVKVLSSCASLHQFSEKGATVKVCVWGGGGGPATLAI